MKRDISTITEKEALRVLKKGGVFSFQDMFSQKALYGDMEEFVRILKEEGFIRDYSVSGEGTSHAVTLVLKHGTNNQKVITGLKRISKPGMRVYAKVNEIPRVLNGLGIAIISTSEGLLTDKQARQKHIGGEILAYVW